MDDCILTIGYQRYAMDAEDAIKVMRLMKKARPVDNFYDEVNGLTWVYEDRKVQLGFQLVDEILDKKPEPQKLEDTLEELDDKAA